MEDGINECKTWLEKPKVRDHFEDRGVDGGTISDECKNDMRKSACCGLVVTVMKHAIL